MTCVVPLVAIMDAIASQLYRQQKKENLGAMPNCVGNRSTH